MTEDRKKEVFPKFMSFVRNLIDENMPEFSEDYELTEEENEFFNRSVKFDFKD